MVEGKERIHKLKLEMANLGYYPYQIERIIKENCHSASIDNMSEDQVQEIANTLEEYVSFARKCWKGTSING